MRLHLASTIVALTFFTGDAFAPSSTSRLSRTANVLSSSVATQQAPTEIEEPADDNKKKVVGKIVPLTGEEINARRDAQLQKLSMKDRTSIQLEKQELICVYEDDDIIVVDKPYGVLTVSGKENNPSLAQAVFDAFDVDLPSADHMVVHRLGMDTSGLIVLAKNKAAVRGLNSVFRNREIERKYEALVAGHIEKDEGMISLPIMRDYEFPPYVRISTDDHQRALLDLDPEVVGKKLLELPKESITKYEVVSREEYNGQPVSRVVLTSISGRYHQLNVHMSAFGHPIVGDSVYGINGAGVTNGGLTDEELNTLAPNPRRSGDEFQWDIAKASADRPTCSHAKFLKFKHPTKEKGWVEFNTDSPF